jgi:Zn-dependent metalloprotease
MKIVYAFLNIKWFGVVLGLLLYSMNISANSNSLFLEDLYKQGLPSTSLRSNISLSEQLGLSSQYTFKQLSSRHTKEGKTVTRYQQFFDGIEVMHGDFIISTKEGKHRVYGSILYDIENDITSTIPTISQQRAKEIVKEDIKAKHSDMKNILDFSKTEVKIFIHNNRSRLVYKISVANNDTTHPFNYQYLIDAHSAEVLASHNMVKHFHTTGVGGNEKTGEYRFGEGQKFGFLDVREENGQCYSENDYVEVYLQNATTHKSNLYQFDCTKGIQNHRVADTIYFATQTYHMYKAYTGVYPLMNGANIQRVKAIVASQNMDSAYWLYGQFIIGAGDTQFYSLSDINVVPHEITHGFTNQHSVLSESLHQSDALDEAFSDMAGEALEYYLTGTNDWLVGAAITKNERAIRDMKNPSSIGGSIEHASKDKDNLKSHYAGGVYNKAFYLLSTSEGWNTKKAFQVYAKANMDYWTSDVDWNHAANGVLESACDLGFEIESIYHSFEVVGIAPTVQPSCDLKPAIFLPSKVDVLEGGVALIEIKNTLKDNTRFTVNYQFMDSMSTAKEEFDYKPIANADMKLINVGTMKYYHQLNIPIYEDYQKEETEYFTIKFNVDSEEMRVFGSFVQINILDNDAIKTVQFNNGQKIMLEDILKVEEIKLSSDTAYEFMVDNHTKALLNDKNIINNSIQEYSLKELQQILIVGASNRQISHFYIRKKDTKSQWKKINISSNPNYIAALTYGTKVKRQEGVVTYQFLEKLPTYYNGEEKAYDNMDSHESEGFEPFNNLNRESTNAMLSSYSDISNLKFKELPSNSAETPTITYAHTFMGSQTGYSPLPGTKGMFDSDVWLSNTPDKDGNDPKNISYKSTRYRTLMHETGHALGLAHPFGILPFYNASSQYNNSKLPEDVNNNQYSIMSYTQRAPTDTLQLYDIAAIQYLYGANMSTRTGNDTYKLADGQKWLGVIWDAGGEDTIDVSNQFSAQKIDLRAGQFSSVGE